MTYDDDDDDDDARRVQFFSYTHIYFLKQRFIFITMVTSVFTYKRLLFSFYIKAFYFFYLSRWFRGFHAYDDVIYKVGEI